MKLVAIILHFIFTMALICPVVSLIFKKEKTVCFTIDEEKTNKQNNGYEEIKKEAKDIISHLCSSVKLLNNSKPFNTSGNPINSSPYLGILTPPPDCL